MKAYTDEFAVRDDGIYRIEQIYTPGTGWYRVTCSECGEDALLECPDEQKKILIGFISRLIELMLWTERD